MTPPNNRSLLLVAVLGAGVTGCLGDGTSLATTEQDVVAPANVTATPTTAHSITISWNGVAGASTYVVLKGIGSGNEHNLTSTFPPTVTTLLDDNDVPNTLYCYTVRAVVGGVASPP